MVARHIDAAGSCFSRLRFALNGKCLGNPAALGHFVSASESSYEGVCIYKLCIHFASRADCAWARLSHPVVSRNTLLHCLYSIVALLLDLSLCLAQSFQRMVASRTVLV